jgi:hypothetical protein
MAPRLRTSGSRFVEGLCIVGRLHAYFSNVKYSGDSRVQPPEFVSVMNTCQMINRDDGISRRRHHLHLPTYTQYSVLGSTEDANDYAQSFACSRAQAEKLSSSEWLRA